MLYNTGLQGLMKLQTQMFQTQNQLSTGRRILSPADDPIGASEALEVSQSQGVNKQFLNNQSDAQLRLSLAEEAVASVGDALMRISELAAQGKRDINSTGQRGMIAAEMKLMLESVIGIANTEDGTGLYIFGGNKSTTKPFEVATAPTPTAPYNLGNTYVEYNGDSGTPSLQVSASKTVDISKSGMDMFMQVRDGQGNITGESVFDSIKNVIDLMDASSGIPYSTAAVDLAMENLDGAFKHVANVRAQFGAAMNSVDALTSTSKDMDFLYDVRLSELQDLDYTEAISRYTRLNTQLEATQLTFKQTSQLSLFNIL
jgi:flagellar hook-associated protein 3 FlgL